MVIFTIGHGNASIFRFIELLRQYEIEALVDVRSSPYSRYVPHFNREDLRFRLRAEGLEYMFAGDYLGGRPKDPACYKNGQIPDGHANFLHLVDYPAVMTRDWYRQGIAHLQEIAGAARVAVMCSEEDPAKCHRQHLIAQTLLANGLEVQHIRHDGELQVAWVIAEKSETEPADPAMQLSIFSVPAQDPVEGEPELTYEPLKPEGFVSAEDFLLSRPGQSKNPAKKKKAMASAGAWEEQKRATEELLRKWKENTESEP